MMYVTSNHPDYSEKYPLCIKGKVNPITGLDRP